MKQYIKYFLLLLTLSSPNKIYSLYSQLDYALDVINCDPNVNPEGKKLNPAWINESKVLLLAAQHNNVSAIDKLLLAGANINVTQPSGVNILHTIAWYGSHHSAIHVLKTINNTDLLNDQDSIHGATPLHFAYHKGDLLMVCILLAFGASTTIKDFNGFTVVDYARQATGFDDTERQSKVRKYMLAILNNSEAYKKFMNMNMKLSSEKHEKKLQSCTRQ